MELKGIIIAPQHVPTWQVVCDFDTSIASEFCDEAATIVLRMLKPGEELQKIENKAKKEIINEIKLLLAEMPIKETAIEMETNLSKNEKGLKHQELIQLYYSVTNINEHQTASLTVEKK